MEITNKLIHKLTDSFAGDPWLGEALLPKLKRIDYRVVNETLHGKNSIAILLKHIINWRVFTIEKLQGNTDFDIEMNSEQDWTPIHITDEASWQQLINELIGTQRTLISILKSKENDAYLSVIVPNKPYNFEHLIEGTILHDTYHAGQIGFLYAIKKQKNLSS
ncbi:DinB family protein [Aquimarina agarivorans]|uniref:DinB family protein n=1 Tax=Aquimarina agarivorans TaxID=980584 RepID=UPI000248F2BE|nr:DinB family protein [Aquimarina agarivorans]